MSEFNKSAALPRTGRRSYARYVVVTAMLSAVAFVLTFIKAPIPALIPGFIKLDVSDLPALIGSFSMGPLCGVLIALLKNLLNVLIEGTTTAYVGELCNFALNAVFALVAGLIYKLHKNRKGAIVGSLVGSVVMGLVSVPVNYFLMYPAYALAFGGMEKIIAAYQTILPGADSLIKCLLIFNLPFTIVKGLLCAVICFAIYKPLSPILHGRK